MSILQTRRQLSLARSLERLAEDVEWPRRRGRNTVIAPCASQVREALPELMAITGRLRSEDAIPPAAVQRLRRLLTDGNGPCYVDGGPGALAAALRIAAAGLWDAGARDDVVVARNDATVARDDTRAEPPLRRSSPVPRMSPNP